MLSNLEKVSSIRFMKLKLLYKNLFISTIATFFVALTLVLFILPRTDALMVWIWFAALVGLNSYRLSGLFFFNKQSGKNTSTEHWYKHFKFGAYAAAVLWGAPMWLFYPYNYPEYQVLLVLALAGVAGAALGVLSYDSKLVVRYQGIILVFIESRLLWNGDSFSLEMAVFSFLYFVFLMKSGVVIGRNYEELINLRYDNEKNNTALLSISEEIAQIGYWQWDMSSNGIQLSENLARMCAVDNTRYDKEFCMQWLHEDDRNRVNMAIESVIETGQVATVEYRMKPSGKQDWMIMNQIIKRIEDSHGNYSLLGTVQDISIIKSAEQKIFDMAFFDELTGLANRSHFHQSLNEQINYAQRNNNKLAVLFIDLDGFKEINDTQGHEQGDEYLKLISARLKGLLRETDFIARLGGDEFCIILNDINEGIDTIRLAERCLDLSQESIVLDFQKINPKMSIGIAVFPEDGTTAGSLLKAADTAMYSAKRAGKHKYAFYNSEMTSRAIARQKLENELKQALLNNEFELWYQPKIALNNYKISGVEALLRWRHPEKGLVMPDQFITVLETMGLINQIGEWVMDNACQQQQSWKQQGIAINMAINIAPGHFSSEGFSQKIVQQMQQYGLNSGDLEIEITESQTRNTEQHLTISQQLREKGIRIAIDDFGTGYSSLSVLKKLAVDTLKVDREFIRELPDEPSSALMVSTIVNMSMALGYEVVAEGVETPEQVEFLQQLGCPVVQGYYFSRPVPAKTIPELVRKNFEPDVKPLNPDVQKNLITEA